MVYTKLYVHRAFYQPNAFSARPLERFAPRPHTVLIRCMYVIFRIESVKTTRIVYGILCTG